MKKYKYRNNTTPKAWKRKKPIHRTLHKSSKLLQKEPNLQQPLEIRKKIPVEMNHGKLSRPVSKKPSHLQSNKMVQSKWTFPTVLLLIVILTIILVVPSIIVAPFMNKDNQEPTIAKELTEPSKYELTQGDSPFSVAVMRVNSEEIENVPLETYVSRVVASEMPVDFELEALKAQALAARTYIVNLLLHQNTDTASDVTDTVQHQVYKNEADLMKQWGNKFSGNMDRIKEAVASTKGEILTYEEMPITPAFFSTSNGFTENSEEYWENELPYLRSVKSPWDKSSPKFSDQKIFSAPEIKSALGIDFPVNNPLAIEIVRTNSKRVKELNVAGKTLTGRDVREKLQLQSSDFTIEQKDGHFIFTTKGFGHGIGMSQYGANGMAKEGKGYKEIVKHYYQGIEISQLSETAPTLVAR